MLTKQAGEQEKIIIFYYFGCNAMYLQHVEGGSSEVDWYLGKRIQVVITFGVRDKVRQGI